MRILENLKLALFTSASLIIFTLTGASIASAVVQYEQNITPDVIFGTGNANGSFTTDRRNGIEIGLRGKLRFNAAGAPENTFNSNSNGTYNFQAIVGPTRTSPTPEWSFEWSVNTNFDNSSGLNLDDLTYELGLDADPGPGTNFLVFDPIIPAPPVTLFFDHSIGTNATGNGAGVEAGDVGTYTTLLATNNVAQNSQRYDFFIFGALAGFDPTAPGSYFIYLLARNGNGDVVARTEIQILVGGVDPVGPDVDHFQCYDIKKQTKLDPRPVVSLTDQFTSETDIELKKKAERYCTPVDKNQEGIKNLDSTLTCYRVDSTKKKQNIVVKNQFGLQEFELKKTKLLCVPSTQLDY